MLRNVPDVWIVHVTDGAESLGAEHAKRRRHEVASSLARGGIAPERLLPSLGFVDMWSVRSLEAMVSTLRTLIERIAPSWILTHPYEGGHPDHDAVAFAVRNVVDALGARAPLLWEAAGYHRGADRSLRRGEFVTDASEVTIEIPLSAEDLRQKDGMLACFESQPLLQLLLPFPTERFRPAPRYDFSQPPAVPLHYELISSSWMDGAEWRSTVAAARAAIDASKTADVPRRRT